MTANRRTIDTEKEGDNIPVSIKIPRLLLNEINAEVEKGIQNKKYTGRTDFICQAARYYLNLVPCPNPECTARNPKDALHCAYCDIALPAYDAEIKNITETAARVNDCKTELNTKYNVFSELYSNIEYRINKERKSIKGDLKKLSANGIELSKQAIERVKPLIDGLNSEFDARREIREMNKNPDGRENPIIANLFGTSPMEIKANVIKYYLDAALRAGNNKTLDVADREKILNGLKQSEMYLQYEINDLQRSITGLEAIETLIDCFTNNK